MDKTLDDYTHYHRTCNSCGRNWWGLHCPHDGYQNPCPSCNKRPETVQGGKQYCDCEFVINVIDARSLISDITTEAVKDALANQATPTVSGKQVDTLSEIFGEIAKGAIVTLDTDPKNKAMAIPVGKFVRLDDVKSIIKRSLAVS